MQSKKTAQGIEVRKFSFPFPCDFQPRWRATDLTLRQLINGTSPFILDSEPFITRLA